MYTLSLLSFCNCFEICHCNKTIINIKQIIEQLIFITSTHYKQCSYAVIHLYTSTPTQTYISNLQSSNCSIYNTEYMPFINSIIKFWRERSTTSTQCIVIDVLFVSACIWAFVKLQVLYMHAYYLYICNSYQLYHIEIWFK